MTQIIFKSMQKEHLPLWEKWITIPHVKDVWFIEGYEASDIIHQKLQGNGYDYPFIIYLDNLPIGYIQSSDLYAYSTKCQNSTGLFTSENKGTWCMDLFIADSNYLNKGYGTKIVKQFIDKIFSEFDASKIYIDPALSNKTAIRCYEKAGFTFDRIANDGVADCYVMKIIKDDPRQNEVKINGL